MSAVAMPPSISNASGHSRLLRCSDFLRFTEIRRAGLLKRELGVRVAARDGDSAVVGDSDSTRGAIPRCPKRYASHMSRHALYQDGAPLLPLARLPITPISL